MVLEDFATNSTIHIAHRSQRQKNKILLFDLETMLTLNGLDLDLSKKFYSSSGQAKFYVKYFY